MGDLSKNFSKLEFQCPCSCGANKISSVLIEKLQKVRNIIGTSIIITSGVRCEFYNTSIKASMNSSHIPDSYGMGNAVDIACTNSKDRYELGELAQKFFKRIGISGGSYGGFIHLDVGIGIHRTAQATQWKGSVHLLQPRIFVKNPQRVGQSNMKIY